MQLGRPMFAIDPKQFGKGPLRVLAEQSEPGLALSADLKLFAMTFLAGFLFVSILIG
ncbi:MAG: hypothetical protein HOP95_08185 [Sphingomonas sp.]|nr:hypothetical protein [Sphingomonas sp.]